MATAKASATGNSEMTASPFFLACSMMMSDTTFFAAADSSAPLDAVLASFLNFPAKKVVSDIIMPRMDGIGLLRRIRQEFPMTRVVMLTSYPDEEAVLSAIIAGASGYLLKQIRARDLVSALESVGLGSDRQRGLERRRLHRPGDGVKAPGPPAQRPRAPPARGRRPGP